jgi:two-component system nitrate/nitrite response regulator NarL
VPKISLLLVTPDRALFERIDACLLARAEVRLIARPVGDGRVVAAVRTERPDVLLVDGASYGARGVRFIQRVAALEVATRSLLLHSEPSEFRLAYVLQSGGGGCLPIACSAYELIRAVEAVHAGELWATRRALADVLHQLRVPLGSVPSDESESALSKREREIVEWMRKGMTNKQIARVLGISDMTVKTHAHNIFHKLEVCGRRVLGALPVLEH